MAPVLPYAATSIASGTSSIPRPLHAFLFALPGLLRWATLIGFCAKLFPGPLRLTADPASAAITLILALWIIAIISAVWSLFYYLRKPHPWYVEVCLLLNKAGLYVSAAAIAIILYVAYG